MFNLIGALILSALLAVVTVLIGEFNDFAWRVLATLGMVMIHSLISLGFIWNDERQNTFDKLSFFANVIFILIVISFITSIFGIWKIVPSDMIGNLYQTYFVLAFASLHGDILSKALGKEKYMNITISANYVFMIAVVLMLQPIIFLSDPSSQLGDFYYRLLAAIGIIDGTLSILTIIFYKIYMHNHPKLENPLIVNKSQEVKKSGLSWWVWLLIIYLVVQIGFPILFLLFNFF